MKSTIVKLLALILAMAMSVFVAGCGEEEVEIIYQYEDESQTASTDAGDTDETTSEDDTDATASEDDADATSSEDDTDATASEDDADATSSKKNETSSKKNETSSKKNETSSKKNETSSKKNETSSKTNETSSKKKKPSSKVESVVNDNVNPADYRGTTITYATWRNPAQYEDGPVVKAFEKKYGITVKIDLMTESEYTQKVLANIQTKNSPDIYFSTYTFPYCIKALQPIDAAKLNLKEAIWDQSLIDLATVNGKTYLVDTVGNIWKDEDMIVYNKKIFEKANIPTPEELQAAGNWNFDTMTQCMKKVAALGTDYVGGAVHLEGLIHSAGASVIGYKNGKFYNGTQNTVTQEIMQWASTGLKEGWLGTTSIYEALNQFPSNKVGIAVLHSFSLKKTGYLRNMKSSDIGFTYLPSYKGNKPTATSFVRGWGLCTGAKNPVAAGIFLRYYLDVNNYDTASAFISKDAENFFFKLTSTPTKNKNFYFCYGSGVTGVTGKNSAVGDYISTPATADPSQVIQTVKKYQGEIEADIAKLNGVLK